MARVRETQLDKSRTSAVYRDRLDKGLRLVLGHLASKDAGILAKLAANQVSNVVLDQWVCEFINMSYEDKRPFWVIKHSVLALQSAYRFLRGKLPRAWDCIGSWEATRSARSRTPVSREVLDFLSSAAFSWALVVPSVAPRMIPLSILIRVCFFGLLRPGEMLKLQVRDVSIDHNTNDNLVAIVALEAPKTRHHSGRNQFAIIDDMRTVCWLRWMMIGLPDSVRLWPSSIQAFR